MQRQHLTHAYYLYDLASQVADTTLHYGSEQQMQEVSWTLQLLSMLLRRFVCYSTLHALCKTGACAVQAHCHLHLWLGT